MKSTLVLTTALTMMATAAIAADVPEQQFRVVGTWGFANMYPEHEAPLWEKHIKDASGGKITATVQPMTDLNLKGFETVKLLDQGLFDVGFGAIAYIVSGDPVFEGGDLALAPGSVEEGRAIAEAYHPVLEKSFADIHNVKLLATYPFPAQVLVCNAPFEGLAELEDRKIRVYSTTLGDMAEGLGGVSVSIPLGEVPTALQRGTIDCGVSSGISMYNSKWYDVVTHLYEIPVSTGLAFVAMSMDKWDALTPETQALIEQETAGFVDRTWAALDESAQQGIACLTGETMGGEPCQYGDPASMTLVRATDADNPVREAVLSDFVLARYADRCGEDCAAEWNATVGEVIGLKAEAK